MFSIVFFVYSCDFEVGYSEGDTFQVDPRLAQAVCEQQVENEITQAIESIEEGKLDEVISKEFPTYISPIDVGARINERLSQLGAETVVNVIGKQNSQTSEMIAERFPQDFAQTVDRVTKEVSEVFTDSTIKENFESVVENNPSLANLNPHATQSWLKEEGANIDRNLLEDGRVILNSFDRNSRDVSFNFGDDQKNVRGTIHEIDSINELRVNLKDGATTISEGNFRRDGSGYRVEPSLRGIIEADVLNRDIYFNSQFSDGQRSVYVEGTAEIAMFRLDSTDPNSYLLATHPNGRRDKIFASVDGRGGVIVYEGDKQGSLVANSGVRFLEDYDPNSETPYRTENIVEGDKSVHFIFGDDNSNRGYLNRIAINSYAEQRVVTGVLGDEGETKLVRKSWDSGINSRTNIIEARGDNEIIFGFTNPNSLEEDYYEVKCTSEACGLVGFPKSQNSPLDSKSETIIGVKRNDDDGTITQTSIIVTEGIFKNAYSTIEFEEGEIVAINDLRFGQEIGAFVELDFDPEVFQVESIYDGYMTLAQQHPQLEAELERLAKSPDARKGLYEVLTGNAPPTSSAQMNEELLKILREGPEEAFSQIQRESVTTSKVVGTIQEAIIGGDIIAIARLELNEDETGIDPLSVVPNVFRSDFEKILEVNSQEVFSQLDSQIQLSIVDTLRQGFGIENPSPELRRAMLNVIEDDDFDVGRGNEDMNIRLLEALKNDEFNREIERKNQELQQVQLQNSMTPQEALEEFQQSIAQNTVSDGWLDTYLQTGKLPEEFTPEQKQSARDLVTDFFRTNKDSIPVGSYWGIPTNDAVVTPEGTSPPFTLADVQALSSDPVIQRVESSNSLIRGSSTVGNFEFIEVDSNLDQDFPIDVRRNIFTHEIEWSRPSILTHEDPQWFSIDQTPEHSPTQVSQLFQELRSLQEDFRGNDFNSGILPRGVEDEELLPPRIKQDIKKAIENSPIPPLRPDNLISSSAPLTSPVPSLRPEGLQSSVPSLPTKPTVAQQATQSGALGERFALGDSLIISIQGTPTNPSTLVRDFNRNIVTLNSNSQNIPLKINGKRIEVDVISIRNDDETEIIVRDRNSDINYRSSGTGEFFEETNS